MITDPARFISTITTLNLVERFLNGDADAKEALPDRLKNLFATGNKETDPTIYAALDRIITAVVSMHALSRDAGSRLATAPTAIQNNGTAPLAHDSAEIQPHERYFDLIKVLPDLSHKDPELDQATKIIGLSKDFYNRKMQSFFRAISNNYHLKATPVEHQSMVARIFAKAIYFDNQQNRSKEVTVKKLAAKVLPTMRTDLAELNTEVSAFSRVGKSFRHLLEKLDSQEYKQLKVLFSEFAEEVSKETNPREEPRANGLPETSSTTYSTRLNLAEILPRLTKDKLDKLADIYRVFKENLESTLKPFFDVLRNHNNDSNLRRLSTNPDNLFGMIVRLMYHVGGQVNIKDLGQAIANQTTRQPKSEQLCVSSHAKHAIDALSILSADEKQQVSNSLRAFVKKLEENNILDKTDPIPLSQ